MKYIIVLLILALLLGPVLWMRPSPLDRRRERVRSKARELGIHVRVCDLPQARRERVRKEPPVLGAAYSLRFADEDPRPGLYWLRLRDGGWEDAIGDAADDDRRRWLDSLAMGLPTGVAAVQVEGPVATVYWDERGGEPAVEAVAAVLRQLAAGAGLQRRV